MTEYPLYLESGPRHKTTMVHALTLLGCTCRGATTEATLAATPAAIRSYLSFLAAHGEPVEPGAEFSTRVEQHVIGSSWIGNGDPAVGFLPDFEPLQEADLVRWRNWLSWLHSDLLRIVSDLPPFVLDDQPEHGRSLYQIYQHLAEGEAVYIHYQVGLVPSRKEAIKRIGASPSELAAGLGELFRIHEARLAALSADELTRFVPHGQVTWSARRMLRRALEHAWEHRVEIQARLQQ